MADEGALRDEPAHGVLRAGGAAGRGGDDDAGPVPVAHVVLYHGRGCSLCDRALEVVEGAQVRLGFDLEVVRIDDDPELEARYRSHLPVVEVDGERAFTYFVDPSALEARLRRGR